MTPYASGPVDVGLCTPAPESWPAIKEALVARGLRVPTPRQRRHWSRAGLLGRPWQEYPIGQGGSVTYYPAGSTERLVAILGVRAGQRKRVDTLRFELWWLGEDVDREVVRDGLAGSVRSSCKTPAALFEQYRGDPDGFADAISRRISESFKKPRGALFRLILSRLGNVEDLVSLAWIVSYISAGGEVERGEHGAGFGERNREQILDSAFGSDRARSDAFPGEEPILQEPLDTLSVYEQLAKAGVLDPTQLPALVEEADPAGLDRARDRARVVIEQLGGAADAGVQLRDRDAFGLGHFAVLFRLRALGYVRGTFVVIFLALERAAPGEQIDHLLALIENESSAAVALGAFMRSHPDLRADMKQAARDGFHTLDEAKQRRIQAEMNEFLADQPELVAGLKDD